MIIKLIILLAIIFAYLYLRKKYETLNPKDRKNFILQVLLYGVAAAILLAVITGRMHWVGAVLAAALGFAKIGITSLIRFFPMLNLMRKQAIFGTPELKTPFLHVKIDLKTGVIHGEIIDGPHKGKSLLDLNEDIIQELEQHYRGKDQRSYFLIKAIGQRLNYFDQNNQQQQSQSSYANVGNPDYAEALKILGLTETATKKDVIQAHRSLMQKLHPDRGGNDFLASQINNAKEIILQEIEKKQKK